MLRIILSIFLLTFLHQIAFAQQDSFNLYHKRSIGFSSGFMGIHSAMAPTFEMKTSPLNYRLRLGFNSLGAGLEFEFGSVMDKGINRFLTTPAIHYIVTLNSHYRWGAFDWSPFRNSRPDVLGEFGIGFLGGIKGYFSKNLAFGIKAGFQGINTTRRIVEWNDQFVRQVLVAYPYGAISFYSYFWRIRTD